MAAAIRQPTSTMDPRMISLVLIMVSRRQTISIIAEMIVNDAAMAKVSGDLENAKRSLADSTFAVTKFTLTGTGSADQLLSAYDSMWAAQLDVVDAQTTLNEALQIMDAGYFRHLPVVEDGIVIGIISVRDVVKYTMMVRDHEVDSLKAYVSRSGGDHGHARL